MYNARALTNISYTDKIWNQVAARVSIGSFSNDNGDDKQDVKKAWFIMQNNNFARALRFFVHFFTVLARLRRENA